MELEILPNQVENGAEIRRRLQRQENFCDEESVAGNEAVSRPHSAKSVASHGASYTESVHSIRLVPVNGDPKMKFWMCGSDRSIWCLIKTILSLVLFLVLNVFAFTNYILDAKMLLMRFLHEQTLDCFIEFGHSGMTLVEGISFLWLIFHDAEFSELLNYVRALQTERPEKDQLATPLCVKITTVCLFASSFFGAIVHAADCGGGIEGVRTWTLKKWLLELHAWWFSMLFFMWTPSAYGKSGEWKKRYAVWSSKNIFYGVVNVMVQFCSALHNFIIQDIILSCVATFFLHARDLARICGPMAKTIEEAQGQTRAILKTQGHSRRFNKAFGTLIRVAIVQELFLFTYLLCEALEAETYALMNAALCIVALKGIIFYTLACKIHDYGQTSLLCAKNLKANFGETIVVDGEVVSLTVLINELESEPIGVGKDGFLINEPFVFGIISSASGIFGLQATGRGKL